MNLNNQRNMTTKKESNGAISWLVLLRNQKWRGYRISVNNVNTAYNME